MNKKQEFGKGLKKLGRRDFLGLTAATGLGVALGGVGSLNCAASQTRDLETSAVPLAAPPMKKVRIGYVGIGGMGSVHVRNLLDIEGAELVALCDIVPEKVERAREWVIEAGQPEPTAYTRGDWDFKRMCEEEELDLVYNATPWRWHVPICVVAMENDKHTATEVPAAYTIDDCWLLVETAEKYRKHCVMMENCNYSRAELMIFNMARQGLFGELLHGEAGYLHDLRGIKFSDEGEGLWRIAHSINRNGNLYPTHGLGPIAQCMDINRGDKFNYLVSMSGNARGLKLYAEREFGADDPRAIQDYILGDVNTSFIKTALGRTIIVKHDCNSPRPYSRINMLQGTKGIFSGYPNRIHIEGRSPAHSWEELTGYEDFEHPLWKAMSEKGEGRGHGSMDYIEDYRLIECLLKGLPTDMNVYDAAAISAVCELSEISVANGSSPVDFPDFTRGEWETNPKREIVGA